MATEREFWGRPFEPGPVRVDPDATAARARVVREALEHIALDPSCDALDRVDRERCHELARYGTDETLAHLGRLLK